MTEPVVWASLVLVGATTWFLTGRFRQYALNRAMVDVPNERSSHHVTTARGGGGGLVVVTTVAFAWCWWSGGSMALPPGVLAGGVMIAVIGFIDDHGHVPAMLRLAGHTLAAVLAVISLGGAAMGLAGAAAAIFFVTWLTNLTNFMDGIDGIAGAQALTVTGAGALLLAVAPSGASLWVEPAILAVSALGFLAWNWPPARVFLGDVGSGYLGFVLAVLTLRAASVSPTLGWAWVLLSGVFITDATVTLVRRAFRRERLFQAHRSHAYQHLARKWGAHRPVTLVVVAVNWGVLAPLAYLITTGAIGPATTVSVTYLCLAILAWSLGAGLPESAHATLMPRHSRRRRH
jgi:Fuc2NAc and GlcNAc transferase